MMSEFTIQHEAQRALGGGAADVDRPGTADSYGSYGDDDFEESLGGASTAEEPAKEPEAAVAAAGNVAAVEALKKQVDDRPMTADSYGSYGEDEFDDHED